VPLTRSLSLFTGLALAATTTAGLVSPATADDGQRGLRDRGVEVGRNAVGAPVTAPTDELQDELAMPASYPVQPRLKVYPDKPDASDAGDLLAYHDLAPLLNGWMRRSDRISTQVVGESTEGRDLYLVTITAPETKAQTSRQARWRDEIRDDPARAAQDQALLKGYKQPIWFSANIHGNEWEGTDGSMQVIEDLVSAPAAQVRDLLRHHRIYFSLTLNPDGRSAGTRATALGLNENRDMITLTTPEAQSFVRTTEALQPLLAADLHGYTDVLQVEPCGPPHGQNYEYDLFLPHGYAMARRVERDVVAADIPGNTYYDVKAGEVVPENTSPDTNHIAIPYRDIPSGWDDFPPIFTAQYAAFFGAITSTVELPLYRPEDTAQSPANARVNTAVAARTIESMIDYVDDKGDALLRNQIKIFKRGITGAPKTSLTRDNIDDVQGPSEWKKHWDKVDDQDPVELPRAYVIPVGPGQRSSADASRLVRQLLFHQIEVGRLDAAATVGGTTYPAGSYVVDLHQPLRGLANSLLDLGADISAKVPTMYDISAWSYAALWGATVARVGSTIDAPVGAVSPVTAPTPGSVPAQPGPVSLDLAGVDDVQAVNDLLDRDVPVSLLADGSAVVAAEERPAVRRAARRFGVTFTLSTPAELTALSAPETKPLDDLTIAYTGIADDTLALTQLGFDDLRAVDAAVLTDKPGILRRADVMWVGGPLEFGPGQGRGRQAVQAFVDAGRPIVGQGIDGFRAAEEFGLVSARRVRGNPFGNGIVAVDTPAGSPLAPFAIPEGFIYPALAFTGLAAGTTAAQTYDATDPFLAGHWRRSKDGVGPAGVAGLASAISGQSASGARGFVFGTSVFFRTHTKGAMGEAARAIFWAVPDAS
jgi:Zinc carboxypeptidase